MEKEFIKELKQNVAYLIGDDDPEVVEVYSQTVLNICEEYHKLRVKGIKPKL
jgi:hypothetical protein